MNETQQSAIKGERALSGGDADRLGFGEVAKRVARSLVDHASDDGLVIGLDGKWGSGKSSLLYLIERSFSEMPKEDRPTVINFRPWLVGNRDALLVSLFSELADKIADVQLARGDATSVTIAKAKKTAEAMRAFAYTVSKAGDFVEAAGTFYQPLTWVGKGIKAIGNVGKKKPDSDLSALKARLTKDLRELGHRFIISVDDVDRLEPSEVVEVLRLVRSVADFPNIIYLLCYDAEILSNAIKRGAKVDDGSAFLEKIVQLTVMVPQPEPFELRNWFARDLSPILGDVAEEAQQRLKTVIDQEGAIQLRTPRSVVRTLDSIRFFWPALKDEKIDIADLVWLLLIKDGSPKLYRWIEEYSANVAAASFGTTSVTDAGKQRSLEALLACAGDRQLEDVMYRHMFAEQLPGIEAEYGGENPPVKIHGTVNRHVKQSAIEGRRLASPDHYRLYFGLIGPTHAVTQASFDSFWQASLAGPEEVAAVLLDLHSQAALGSLRKSDVLFERLRSINPELIASTSAKNLLLAFARMMDDAWRIDPSEQFFIVTIWDRAERLIPILLGRLLIAEREQVVREMFANGLSLGWLTSIFRHEIFSHGIFGNQAQPEEKWFLSREDYKQASELMLARYRAMRLDEILAAPRPMHLLFAWNQGGNETEPRALVAKSIATDDGLVTVLESMTSSIDSSDRGRYTILKRENLSPFLDYDSVRERLASILKTDSPLKPRAARLFQAFEDGQRD